MNTKWQIQTSCLPENKMWKASAIILQFLCLLHCTSEVQNEVIFRSPIQSRLVRSGDLPTKCAADTYIICKDCTRLVACIGTGSGATTTYNEMSLANCTSPQTCKSGSCVNDPSDTCSSIADTPFMCTQPGIFPDPVDCKKYHICNKAKAADFVICPKDSSNQEYGFNQKTLLCSDKLPNNKCPGKPIPDCIEGRFGPFNQQHPSYYHWCYPVQGKLYPTQFVCPYGQTFQITKKACA